jgi:hypothetical protein
MADLVRLPIRRLPLWTTFRSSRRRPVSETIDRNTVRNGERDTQARSAASDGCMPADFVAKGNTGQAKFLDQRGTIP